MKTAAILLAIIAVVVATIAGTQLQQTTASASTAQIEKTIKDLSGKIEVAKVKESNDEVTWKKAVDTEVAAKGVNPRVAEQLKAGIKERASETSSMPALKEAADESNNLKTQVEALKKETTTTASPINWSTYIPKLAISLILLCASLFIILKGGYPDHIEKFALSTISIIVGIWVGTVTS